MKSLTSLYEQFQHAVITGDNETIKPSLKAHPRLTPAQQMDIYQYGYKLRLAEAITSDYPALAAYLGEEKMQQLAAAYVQAHPSQSYNLDRYSLGFAAWYVTQQKDQFAIELAQLEQAIADVFMMPESVPADAAILAQLSPETFGQVVLKPRAASKLMAFSYPVEQWLSAQRSGTLLPAPTIQPSYRYLYRHENEVKRAELTQAAYILFSKLVAGIPVGEALDVLAEKNPEHLEEVAANLQSWFGQWLSGGYFMQSN